MKRAVILLFFSAVFFGFTQTMVLAQKDSGQSEFLDSLVKSIVNSSSSTSQTHVNIRVESNGQVKTYESDTPGSVVVESEDGNARAEVYTNIGGENSITISPESITIMPTIPPIPTIKAKIKEDVEKIINITGYPKKQVIIKSQNIFERVNDFLKKLFSVFKI